MSSIKVRDSKIIAISTDDSKFDIVAPDYITIENFAEYQFVGGVWENIKIDYQYIIIPADLLTQLTDITFLVENVHPEMSFNVILEREEVELRNEEKKQIAVNVLNMTPCSVLEWEGGDDENGSDNILLKGIVSMWNSHNPSKIIDFPCRLKSVEALNEFINLQSV